MKYRIILSAVLALALLAGITAISGENQATDDEALRRSIGDQLFQKYHRGELDRREFDEFVRMLAASPHRSYMETSAARYLESQGYQEVSLHGLRKLSLDSNRGEKEYQIASCWPKMYALDLTFREPLPPGMYWGKVNAFSVDILDQEGKLQNYGIKEIE
ncbi:MAG: hypothetical protein WAU88_11210 [Candidatus Zixiibacteriota bacterium]